MLPLLELVMLLVEYSFDILMSDEQKKVLLNIYNHFVAGESYVVQKMMGMGKSTALATTIGMLGAHLFGISPMFACPPRLYIQNMQLMAGRFQYAFGKKGVMIRMKRSPGSCTPTHMRYLCARFRMWRCGGTM